MKQKIKLVKPNSKPIDPEDLKPGKHSANMISVEVVTEGVGRFAEQVLEVTYMIPYQALKP